VAIRFEAHALARMSERGATEQEVTAAIESGERFEAKFQRVGFRRNFAFDATWRSKHYNVKQVEAFAAWEDQDWVVITVIVRFF